MEVQLFSTVSEIGSIALCGGSNAGYARRFQLLAQHISKGEFTHEMNRFYADISRL